MDSEYEQKIRASVNRHKIREEDTGEQCPYCGGKVLSGNGVIIYCEEGWYNTESDCDYVIASG